MNERRPNEPESEELQAEIERVNAARNMETAFMFYIHHFRSQVDALRTYLDSLDGNPDPQYASLEVAPMWCGIMFYNVMREVLLRRGIQPAIIPYEEFMGDPGLDGWTAEQAAQFLDLLKVHPDPDKRAIYHHLIHQ